jgi:hypothetical protein
MKKYLYIPLLFLICVLTAAQNNAILKIPEVDSVFASRITGSFFLERKQYFGDQYYNFDWAEGNILLTTGEMVSVKFLKYNGLFDELIWLNAYNYKFKVDKSFISEFWLKDIEDSYIHFKRFNFNTNDSVQSFFAEVKVEGKISLYVQRKITPQWPEYLVVNNVRVQYDVLKPTPIYYIKLPSDQYIILNKLHRRTFLKSFPDKKQAINKLINVNHLNIKNEVDFVRLIELMNENQMIHK